MTKAAITCFLLCISVLSKANSLQQAYTFHFQDRPIIEVLEVIETVAGINFSFNSDIIDTAKHVSTSFTNQPLKEIIEQLFPPQYYQYLFQGNQLMLAWAPQPKKRAAPAPEQQNKEQPLCTTYDTIRVHDTVWFSYIDTLWASDTILIYDTIKSEQKRPLPQPAKNNYVPYVGIGAGYIPAIPDLNQTIAMSDSVRFRTSSSFTITGAEIHAGIQNRYWGLETGLSIVSIKQMYKSSKSLTHTGFSTQTSTDSIIHTDSAYYAIAGLDTVWKKTETTEYISKEQQHPYTYQTTDSAEQINRLYYLSVPVRLLVCPLRTEKHRLHIGGGITTYLLYKTKGSMLSNAKAPYPEYISSFARKSFSTYTLLAVYGYNPSDHIAVCAQYAYHTSNEGFITMNNATFSYSQISILLRYYF